jgi:hypothetical protein
MDLHQELPVYKAIYDLLLEIFSFTTEFSKEYKYTIGESLKKETIELLTLILYNLQLTLHPHKIYLQHYTKGVQFLGVFIKPNLIYIASRTKMDDQHIHLL